jgi:manganese transport protein
MGIFAIKPLTKIAAWLIAAIIAVLNFKLVYDEVVGWIGEANNIVVTVLLILGAVGLFALLMMTVLYPILLKSKPTELEVHPPFEALHFEHKGSFKKVVIALDFSNSDQKVIQYALQLSHDDTTFVVVHIVESASVKYTGDSTDDYESRQDLERLKLYADFLLSQGHQTEYELGYNNRIKSIAEVCEKYGADLLVVGSHGHSGVKDFVFGETVNKLRHAVKVPVFIAQ